MPIIVCLELCGVFNKLDPTTRFQGIVDLFYVSLPIRDGPCQMPRVDKIERVLFQ